MNMKPNLVAEELARFIGFIATIRLCAVYGGRSLYVPGIAEPDHFLATLLGAEAFAALVKEFRSITIAVPKVEEFERWSKVRQVSQFLSKGATPKEISRALTLTPRYVRMLRKDAEKIGLLPMVLTSGQGKQAAEQVAMFDAYPTDSQEVWPDQRQAQAEFLFGGAPEGHPPARVRRAAPSS